MNKNEKKRLKGYWIGAASIALIRQALLAWKILGKAEALSLKRTFQARKVASLLLLTSIVISSIIFFNIVGNRVVYGSIGFIFWADLLLLVVSYMDLLPSALQQKWHGHKNLPRENSARISSGNAVKSKRQI